jgi:hypothetical protein
MRRIRRGGRCRRRAHAARFLHYRTRQLERDLLERVLPADRRRGARRQRREHAQRRQTIAVERHTGRARIEREPREQCGRELEGETAVALTVPVRAFERAARIPEQQGPRRHQRRAVVAAIDEGPGQHERERGPQVALLEWPIVRPAGADDVDHPPPLPLRHRSTVGRAGFADPGLAGERSCNRLVGGCLLSEQLRQVSGRRSRQWAIFPPEKHGQPVEARGWMRLPARPVR